MQFRSRPVYLQVLQEASVVQCDMGLPKFQQQQEEGLLVYHSQLLGRLKLHGGHTHYLLGEKSM